MITVAGLHDRSRSSAVAAAPAAGDTVRARDRRTKRIEFDARRSRRLAAAQPPRQAQLLHDPDVARDARARQGAARRPRSARARRDRQRAARSRRASTRRCSPAAATDAIEGGDDAGTRHADPTVDGILRTQEAYSWLETARYPTIAAVRGYALGAGLQLRARVRHPRVRARHVGRAARAQVRHPSRPRRHAAAATRRRCGQGEGDDLDRGAHRRRRGVPHRPVRTARRRRRRSRRKSTALAATIAAQPPLAVQGAKRAVEAAGRAAGRRRAGRRGRGAGGLPAVGRHARGDHGVRRTTRTRLLGQVGSSRHDPIPRPRASGPLEGRVAVSGATKNSGLKQMAAALLAPGVTTLRNMPAVRDLDVMIELLRATGARRRPARARRRARRRDRRPRARGAVRARRAHARVVQRARPAARALRRGARRAAGRRQHRQPQGRHAPPRPRGDGRRGRGRARLRRTRAPSCCTARACVLEFPSVGATENLMCAAVLAKGTTVIENAAREPEVTDLAAFLDRMGAQVVGAGTSTIEIEGVEELARRRQRDHGRPRRGRHAADGVRHRGRRDRARRHRGSSTSRSSSMKLCEMGMRVSPTSDGLWALRREPAAARSTSRRCRIPGFATDFMPLAVALMTVAEGSAIVTENVYDGRFQFVDELARMGADVRTEGRHAIVRGRRAAVGRAGARPPTCGPAPRSCSPGSWPRARRSSTTASTSTGAIPTSPATLRALGADVERLTTEPRRSGPRREAAPRYSRRSGTAAILAALCGRPCTDERRPDGARSRHMEDGILEAIEAIRPALQSDGGDIVFNGIDEDGVVHVSLVGACGTCPVSMMTLKAGVERIIMDRVPGVTEVVADE